MRRNINEVGIQGLSFSPFPNSRGASAHFNFNSLKPKRNQRNQQISADINYTDQKSNLLDIKAQLTKIKFQVSNLNHHESQKIKSNSIDRKSTFSQMNNMVYPQSSLEPHYFNNQKDLIKESIEKNSLESLYENQLLREQLKNALKRQKGLLEEKSKVIQNQQNSDKDDLKFGFQFRDKNNFKNVEKSMKTLEQVYKLKIQELTKLHYNQIQDLKTKIVELQAKTVRKNIDSNDQSNKTPKVLQFNSKNNHNSNNINNPQNRQLKTNNNPQKEQQSQNTINNLKNQLKYCNNLLSQKQTKIHNLQSIILQQKKQSELEIRELKLNIQLSKKMFEVNQNLKQQVKKLEENLIQQRNQNSQLKQQADQLKQKLKQIEQQGNKGLGIKSIDDKIIAQMRKKDKTINVLIGQVKYLEKEVKQLNKQKRTFYNLSDLVKNYNETIFSNNLVKINQKYKY